MRAGLRVVAVVVPIENLTEPISPHQSATSPARNFGSFIQSCVHRMGGRIGAVEHGSAVRLAVTLCLSKKSSFDLAHSTQHIFECQLQQWNTNEELVGDRILIHGFLAGNGQKHTSGGRPKAKSVGGRLPLVSVLAHPSGKRFSCAFPTEQIDRDIKVLRLGGRLPDRAQFLVSNVDDVR